MSEKMLTGCNCNCFNIVDCNELLNKKISNFSNFLCCKYQILKFLYKTLLKYFWNSNNYIYIMMISNLLYFENIVLNFPNSENFAIQNV